MTQRTARLPHLDPPTRPRAGWLSRAGGAEAPVTLGLALAAALAWPGCQSDETGGGGAAGTATGTTTQTTSTATGSTSSGGTGGSGAAGGTGGGTAGAGGASCDAAAFVPVAQDAGPFMSGFVYVAQNTLSAPVDMLTFELTEGTPAVGSLSITNAGYDTCTNCVLIYRGCDVNLENCTSTLMAQGGRIDVTSTGTTDDTFAGTLYDAEFVEVTIENNGATTPVTGGEQFCQAPYAFSAVIQ